MAGPLASSPLPYEPGQFDDVKIDDDFFFGSASGSISGPGTDTAFISPSFGAGEVWAVKQRLTISEEPSNGLVILEFMDEEETDFIQKATIPVNGGNDAEVNTIADWNSVDFSSGASSPDTRVTAEASDTFNYFIDSVCVRLRQPDDQSDRSGTIYNDHSFDV